MTIMNGLEHLKALRVLCYGNNAATITGIVGLVVHACKKKMFDTSCKDKMPVWIDCIYICRSDPGAALALTLLTLSAVSLTWLQVTRVV